MFVSDYMTKNPVVLTPDDDVKNAFDLLIENRIRQAPVLDNGDLVGIVTDRDLRMAIVQNLKVNSLTVGIVMTKDPATVTSDTKITEAGRLICLGKFNALPVIKEDGKLVGIITSTDILKCLIEAIDENFIPLITK